MIDKESFLVCMTSDYNSHERPHDARGSRGPGDIITIISEVVQFRILQKREAELCEFHDAGHLLFDDLKTVNLSMTEKPILEVCAFNVQSCIIAERAGAMRVELCDNPIEGGTTPSYGTIKTVREKIAIRLYPIIRPRSGNYFYDKEEYEIIKNDIRICRELGCDGISVGAATITGEIDTEWLKRIVEWAGLMGVTCNRAFDGTPDPFKALEDLIDCGCERVLTSGQKASAPEAGALLGKLVKQANGRLSIMPGAGIKSYNIEQLHKACNAKEYHASARKVIPNPLAYINTLVSDYGNVYVADQEEVRAMVAILEQQRT
jgi:copper homeostasis protein